MDILKQLRISGREDVTSVLIKDGDMEYPVFLDSLLNTVMFDELLNSGWEFCGFPYNFQKNGIKLSQLEIIDYNPTATEQQDMWDLIGEKLPMEELKKHISIKSLNAVEMREGDYTILTRDDFLKYLDMLSNIEMEDFIPLNYFVHPSARFTFEEYVSGQYSRYTTIIERRRRMTYAKFKKLRQWLVEKTDINPSCSPIDLLDAYYSWGIDGLQMSYITKKREMRYRTLGASDVAIDMSQRQYVMRHEIGLVDNTGTIIVPEESRSINWKPNVTNIQVFNDTYVGLKPNDTAVVDLVTQSSTEVTILEGVEATVMYDSTTLLVGPRKSLNLQVVPTIASFKIVAPEYWREDKENELKQINYFRAIARLAINKCIQPSSATSFKALTLSGCSPLTALYYYILSQNLNSPNLEDTTMPIITLQHAHDYCEGKLTNDEIYDILDNFVNGITNIGHTYNGIRAEDEYSAESMYNEIYTIVKILGISPDTVCERITAMPDDEEEIVFEGNGYTHTLKLPKLTLRTNGYNMDLENYRDEALYKAVEYTYITVAAREIAAGETRRHVALECLTLFRTSKANNMLNQLSSDFNAEVDQRIVGIQQQVAYKKLSRMFAASRFFEAALEGTITYPTAVGGKKIHLTPEQSQQYRNLLTNNIESTTLYCESSVDSFGNFRRYCVNAYVTPEYIIPKSKYKIKESSFVALYRDFSSRPDLVEKFVNLGLITRNHVPWDFRYFNDRMCDIDMLSNRTLLFYNTNAIEYRNNVSPNEEFNAAPHPLEYLEPGLYTDDETVILDTPRDKTPPYKVGEVYIRSISDYKDILSIDRDEKLTIVGFKPFQEFTAEDIYYRPDVLEITIPMSNNSITIYGNTKFYTKSLGIQDYTVIPTLDEKTFPVVHVHDRKYIIRDIKGKYWEVEV